MKNRMAIAALAALMLGPVTANAGEDRVLDFPENYRSDFTRYFSGDRYLAEEQTITLYANGVALDGAGEDGKPPSGSVLVAEVYGAIKDANGEVVESTLGRRLPGDLKAIVVMERRDGWDDQYPDDLKVGDWEFEVFNTAGENLGKDTTGCRECHQPLDDTEFMFSLEHLVAAAR